MVTCRQALSIAAHDWQHSSCWSTIAHYCQLEQQSRIGIRGFEIQTLECARKHGWAEWALSVPPPNKVVQQKLHKILVADTYTLSTQTDTEQLEIGALPSSPEGRGGGLI